MILNPLFNLLLIIVLILTIIFILKRSKIKRLASFNSPISGRVEVLENPNKERVLVTNLYPQGLSINHPTIKESYWYKIAKEAVKETKTEEILILGLGANTTSSLIAKFKPKIKQTIIEIDPVIIKVCREYFNLDGLPNSQIIQADAHKALDPKSKILKAKYDCIISDIFLFTPPYIDPISDDKEFVLKLLPHLKKNGTVIFNRHAHDENFRQSAKELANHLKTIFKNVEIFDVQDIRGFRNFIVVGHSPFLKG